MPKTKKLERIVEFAPAFDKRDPNPKKDYGIHGVELRFVVKGEEGAVHFLIYTNWHLPHVQKGLVIEGLKSPRVLEALFTPLPVGLAYHAKLPRYPEQEPSTKECEYCNGEPCYCDSSGVNAQKVFDLLVKKGDEAVWKFLENYYNARVKPTPADIYLESIGEGSTEETPS